MDNGRFELYYGGRYLRIVNERENFGAGIYAALSALLIFICLIGAFVLPPSLFHGKWPAVFVLVAFFVGIPVLLRLAHRSRIRNAVHELGGTALKIKKLPFWRQPLSTGKYAFFFGERHEVRYVDLFGATHRAVCNSGFFQGVEWLEDTIVDGP
jgi:hypothetical protein